jgi:hypothetical protein
VTVRLEPRAAEDLMKWRAAKRIDEGPDERGWLLFRAEFDDEEHACFVMQGLSGRAELLEPVALRKRILMNARATVRIIEGGT